jgi:hypothetical protein
LSPISNGIQDQKGGQKTIRVKPAFDSLRFIKKDIPLPAEARPGLYTAEMTHRRRNSNGVIYHEKGSHMFFGSAKKDDNFETGVIFLEAEKFGIYETVPNYGHLRAVAVNNNDSPSVIAYSIYRTLADSHEFEPVLSNDYLSISFLILWAKNSVERTVEFTQTSAPLSTRVFDQFGNNGIIKVDCPNRKWLDLEINEKLMRSY